MDHDEAEEFLATEEAEIEAVSPPATSKNLVRVYLNLVLRKWFIIVAFAGAGLVVTSYLSTQDPSTYVGRFEILIEPVTSAEKLTDASVLTRSNDLPSQELLNLDYPTQLKILKSTVLLSKIAAEVHNILPQIPEAAMLQNLQKNLIVKRVQEGNSRFDYTKILEVIYEGNDAVLVETVLKVTAEQYLQYSLQERENSLQAGVSFIDEQIPILETQIRALQGQQRTLQQRYNIISPNQQATNLNEAYQANQLDIQKIDEELEELRSLKSNLESTLGLSPSEALVALDLSQNPERQNLLQQLQEVETMIAAESSRFTNENPIMQDLFQKRNNLQTLLETRTKEILKSSSLKGDNNPNIFMFQNTSRITMLDQLIVTQNEIAKRLTRRQVLVANQERLRINLDQFPTIAAQYDEVARQLDLKKGLLDTLANQRETLRVEAAQQDVPWKIISAPAIPRGPDGLPISFPPDPKKKMIAGMGGGLVLGLLLAIAWERSRNIFYSNSDLKFGLGYSVWGELPLLDSGIAHDKDALEDEVLPTEANEAIVAMGEDRGQQIYTNFYFQYQEQGIRSMAMTAIDNESGQASVTMQFARAAVNAGQTVLVIDTNLQHPDIHHHGNNTDELEQGLVNVLNSDTDPQQLLNLVHYEDGLAIIPVGTMNAGHPIRLQRWLSRLDPALQTLTHKYDLVIYNAPLLTVPDTPFLLNRTDGVCLIVRLKYTSQSQTHQALTTVEKFQIPVLGVIATI
jgi:uncharacterized protein involved in exopolysaccharide biosynthesis/Mrp family chromosome partitioning ATPase